MWECYNRLDRKPQAGEAISIEVRSVLTFKPSAMLKASVNK